MPAIQNEYDDYGYIAMRRGTAKAAPRVSDSKKSVAVKKSVVKSATKSVATKKNVSKNVTTKKAVPTKVNVSKMAAAKKANNDSIRAVMRDNSKSVASKNVATKKVTVNKNNVSKPKEMSLKKADMVRSPKQNAKVKTLKKENILRNTATFLCVFSALFLVCYRSSVINESFRELKMIKTELATASTVNAQIESDIETQTDISSIESYAKYQLGMQKPKESQIQRIVVQKEDKISTPVVIEEEKTSFWDNLVNDVLNILD